jgi:hypothetical protein
MCNSHACIVRLDSGSRRAASPITSISAIMIIELIHICFCCLWVCRITKCEALFAGQVWLPPMSSCKSLPRDMYEPIVTHGSKITTLHAVKTPSSPPCEHRHRSGGHTNTAIAASVPPSPRRRPHQPTPSSRWWPHPHRGGGHTNTAIAAMASLMPPSRRQSHRHCSDAHTNTAIAAAIPPSSRRWLHQRHRCGGHTNTTIAAVVPPSTQRRPHQHRGGGPTVIAATAIRTLPSPRWPHPHRRNGPTDTATPLMLLATSG